jgi:hypothetical protein
MDEQKPLLELTDELSSLYCYEMILREMSKSNHSQKCIETTKTLIASKFAAYSLYNTKSDKLIEEKNG